MVRTRNVGTALFATNVQVPATFSSACSLVTPREAITYQLAIFAAMRAWAVAGLFCT